MEAIEKKCGPASKRGAGGSTKGISKKAAAAASAAVAALTGASLDQALGGGGGGGKKGGRKSSSNNNNTGGVSSLMSMEFKQESFSIQDTSSSTSTTPTTAGTVMDFEPMLTNLGETTRMRFNSTAAGGGSSAKSESCQLFFSFWVFKKNKI